MYEYAASELEFVNKSKNRLFNLKNLNSSYKNVFYSITHGWYCNWMSGISSWAWPVRRWNRSGGGGRDVEPPFATPRLSLLQPGVRVEYTRTNGAGTPSFSSGRFNHDSTLHRLKSRLERGEGLTKEKMLAISFSATDIVVVVVTAVLIDYELLFSTWFSCLWLYIYRI